MPSDPCSLLSGTMGIEKRVKCEGITQDGYAAGECSLGTSQIACEETFGHSAAGLVLQRAPADEILGKPIFTSLKLWEDIYFLIGKSGSAPS